MSRAIIFVPGKSPKPPPAIHRDYLWRCLRRGVAGSDPEAVAALDECRFSVAAWNFLYYRRHASLVADVPWIERLIESAGAGEQDIREARHWSKWLTRLMYTLGDNAHWLLRWLPDPRIKSMIQDTSRYFDNTGSIAGQIRAAVKEALRRAHEQSGALCIIGHSMGSVIAYETLWESTHVDGRTIPVELFLTLGSPLGMNYVQKKLPGLGDGSRRYPAGIHKWVNLSAVGDLVSVDQRVRDDFAPMVEQGRVSAIEDYYGDIYTAFRNDDGLNPHRSYGYLVHPRVGEVVGRWCRGEPG